MPIHPFRGTYPTIGPDVFIADGARVIGRVSLGQRASVWFNAVLRGDIEEIRVGERTNIQDNSTVHVDDDHPSTIGDDVTIGHGVTVHACTIEDQVLIGMNAVLLTGCRVGWGSIIGAHALVAGGKVIPPRSLVLGSPGRVVREVTGDELRHLLESAARYVETATEYIKHQPGR